MTGEMSWIKPDGTDSNGDSYPLHAAIARRFKAPLRPFDVYIGPYIAHPLGSIFLSMDADGTGQVCLWPGGVAPAYRAPAVLNYWPADSVQSAARATSEVLKRVRAQL